MNQLIEIGDRVIISENSYFFSGETGRLIHKGYHSDSQVEIGIVALDKPNKVPFPHIQIRFLKKVEPLENVEF